MFTKPDIPIQSLAAFGIGKEILIISGTEIAAQADALAASTARREANVH